MTAQTQYMTPNVVQTALRFRDSRRDILPAPGYNAQDKRIAPRRLPLLAPRCLPV